MNFAIEAENLTKTFGRVRAVDSVNLNIPQGAIFGLIGINGAGKTTTIKILMNIMRASAGHAQVLGTNSEHLSYRHFTEIGYVSENQELPDWMNVAYLLKYLADFYPAWDHALARDLLREFDLPLDRLLGKMSRGMRLKASLLSSLAYRPRVIFLDEPFSGLDALVRDEVAQGLLSRAVDTTILIYSHDLAEIETFASHIGYMESGRLLFDEEMASLLGRFREIELTFASAAPHPQTVPDHWLNLEVSPAVVRFTESRFDEPRTFDEISRIFGHVKDIMVTPIPLRDIFVTLARSTRKRGERH